VPRPTREATEDKVQDKGGLLRPSLYLWCRSFVPGVRLWGDCRGLGRACAASGRRQNCGNGQIARPKMRRNWPGMVCRAMDCRPSGGAATNAATN